MAEYNAEVLRLHNTEGLGSLRFYLQLRVPPIVVEPGQFFRLRPLDQKTIPWKPFSVMDISENGDELLFLIEIVGKTTADYYFGGLREGSFIKIDGPLGNPIPFDGGFAPSYILVAGGTGIAGLSLFAKKLGKSKKSFDAILGFKEKKHITGIEFFEKYADDFYITVEEEYQSFLMDQVSIDLQGRPTNVLHSLLEEDGGASIVVACGPGGMLRKAAELCEAYGNECLVGLEEFMGCGSGACKSCTVFDRQGFSHRVCMEGPFFNSKEIDWKRYYPEAAKPVDIFPGRPFMGVELVGLKMESPLVNAAGCLGIEELEKGQIDCEPLGALVPKSISLMGRPGNATPRMCETPSGVINSIGLQNEGIDNFIENELFRWLAFGKPVIVNIAGESLKEYEQLASAVSETQAAGIEVNISCPNVEKGIVFGVNPALAKEVVMAVKAAAPEKIIIVKLTPNVTDIVEIARAAMEGGADAISLINTLRAASINPYTRKARLANIYGGLSGPAIRPISIGKIMDVFQANLGLPIIGMGGVEGGESAAELALAGANLIGIGTGRFKNRKIFAETLRELAGIVRNNGFSSYAEFVGQAIL